MTLRTGLRADALWSRLGALDPLAIWVEIWADATRRALEEPAFRRDPEFLRLLLRLMDAFNAYFDAEVRGLENLPAAGPLLLVGNHSGGVLTPDTTALYAAWYRTQGLDRPLVGLAMDAAFGIPGFGELMRRIGQVPASMEHAGRALDEGAAVLVYPGGDWEVFRPWTRRNRIDFGGRRGFVRLALRKGVPVVPVVGHGGHETTVVLARGDGLARLLGLRRLRMHVLPILWQVPWGVSLPLPGLPLPAKITLRVLPPLDWSRHGPEAAADPAVVDRCYAEITGVMQTALTALARERPQPLWSRVRDLVAGAEGR